MVARMRLGAALRPHLDSIDLVQSVHRSLLIGIRENRFDISSPQKLIALALTIVRRKVARQWRHLKRQQRLSHANEDDSSEPLVDVLVSLQSPAPDVSDEVASRENLKRLLAELDPIETKLITMRIEGFSTAQAAQVLDLDPDVLRVKLSRLRKRLRERGFENDLL
jgi:RNA polymerase sigma factor (sigma-70 family)